METTITSRQQLDTRAPADGSADGRISTGETPAAVPRWDQRRTPCSPVPASLRAKQYRARQREELLCLRQRARVLETTLRTLRRSRRSIGGCAESEDKGEDHATLWQQYAARQRKRRQRAEVENAKLRALLAAQHKQAQRLEDLLRRMTLNAELFVPKPLVLKNGYTPSLSIHPSFLTTYPAQTDHPIRQSLHHRQHTTNTTNRKTNSPMDVLLPDDTEPLAAALAMIDAWEAVDLSLEPPPSSTASPMGSSTTAEDDSEEQHSSTSSPPPLPLSLPSSTATTPSSEPSLQSMCTSSRRKREIEYLRSKASELEAELAALKSRADTWRATAPSGAVSKATLWEQIAGRQLTQRVQSEKTNAKLRMTLQHQVQVARDLMRSLTKASRRQEVEELVGGASKRAKTHALRVEEQVELQQRRVDALRGRAASVFASTHFQTNKSAFRDVELMEDSLTGDATICIRASWAVPFAVHQVGAVIWRFMVRKAGDGGDESQDRLNIVYSTEASRPGMVGTFAGRMIARRHALSSPTGELFAWVKQSEPLAFEPTPLDGVLLEEEALLRVQPVATSVASDSDAVALVQSWRRLRLHFEGADVLDGRRKIGALTEYLLEEVEQELSWKQRVIENLLLEAAMSSGVSRASLRDS